MEYAEQRKQELQPLADALTIHVRGTTDVHVEQTGGGVYCVEANLGGWRIDADEAGWSLTGADGQSIAWGGWYEDGHFLTPDPDTGALDPDECEAAAIAFAGAYTALLAEYGITL